MLQVVFDLDLFLVYGWIILLGILLLYILWDVNYFLRVGFTVGSALYFEKNVKPDQTTTVYGKKCFTMFLANDKQTFKQ